MLNSYQFSTRENQTAASWWKNRPPPRKWQNQNEHEKEPWRTTVNRPGGT